MIGNEWPPLVVQEGREMPDIIANFLVNDLPDKSSERVTYHASSLNSAYDQLSQHGLVAVTTEFQALYEGPKMKILLHKLLEWDLVKVAVQKPARGVLREGENSQAKSLSGPVPSSSLSPLDNFSCPGRKVAAVVNSCKRKRKKRMTAAKAVQLSNRCLFRTECKKKRKRGRRKSKGEKAGRNSDSEAREKVGGKRVGTKKYQKKVLPSDYAGQKVEAAADSDLDAKVCDHYNDKSLVFLL